MHGANTSLRRTCVLFQARNNPAGLARITFFDFYRQRTELCELLYARSVQDTSSNVAWFFAIPLASRSSLRARGIDSRARGTSVRRAALLHASPVELADQPARAITRVWCATASGEEPTRPLRTLVDESGFGEGPVRRPGGRREGRGSSATRPLLVFGHRGRAHSRLQKTLCAAPSSVPMKSPAAGGGVPSRPPAGRKGSTSQSMLRRARLSNTPGSRE